MNLSKYNWNFTLFGVPVCVMPSFWILCVLFSPFVSGYGGEGSWLFGLIGWSAAVLLSFLLHELGHALAARRLLGARPTIDLGIGRGSSGAFVFGGVTSWTPTFNASHKSRAIVSAAGPCAALIGAVVLLLIAFLEGSSFSYTLELGFLPVVFPTDWLIGVQSSSPIRMAFSYFVYGFFWIGFFWSFVNLVPIFPLDGGQVLTSALVAKNGARGALLGLKISIACGVVVAALFLSEGSLFAAFFFFYLAYRNYQTLKYSGSIY